MIDRGVGLHQQALVHLPDGGHDTARERCLAAQHIRTWVAEHEQRFPLTQRACGCRVQGRHIQVSGQERQITAAVETHDSRSRAPPISSYDLDAIGALNHVGVGDNPLGEFHARPGPERHEHLDNRWGHPRHHFGIRFGSHFGIRFGRRRSGLRATTGVPGQPRWGVRRPRRDDGWNGSGASGPRPGSRGVCSGPSA